MKAVVRRGKVLNNSGYKYIDFAGVSMVEYHVDSCEEAQERASVETRFSGFLSILIKNDQPLLIFGHY
jgi:hypothetical protein